MQRIRTDEAPSRVGERVKLAGWMHNWRDMGKFGFLVLRDGAGTFQAVLDDAAELEKLKGLQYESVLEVEGVVTPEPRAAAGAELHDCQVNVISPVLAVFDAYDFEEAVFRRKVCKSHDSDTEIPVAMCAVPFEGT